MKKFSTTFIVSTLFISGFSGAIAPLNALAEQSSIVQYKEPVYYDQVSVNLTQSLSKSYTITLNTPYSITEASTIKLEPGTYTVQKNSSNIQLLKDEKIIHSGSSFNIFPIAYSLNSYVTFANTKYSYLGDLAFSLNADNTIKIINSLPTEHYLYGVVPYEMSESWASSGGLEALKAQAAAARTYTMARISRDLLDTTADQVYKGYNPSNVNSINAVNQTQGVYITHNGKPIENAFYSSTNGGYTMSVANVYNNSNLPYLQFKKDSFDANKVTSHKNWGFTLHQTQIADYSSLASKVGAFDMSTAVEVDSGLSQFEGLKNTIKKNVGASSTQDIKILNIPTLTFSTVDANTTSTTKLQGTITVNYALYNKSTPKDYKILTYTITQRTYNFYTAVFFGSSNGLGNLRSANISTSSLSNGVYTIKGNGWGHGMGMSQWGAYQRSIAGQSYVDILNFYYDNTVLTKKSSSNVYSNPSITPNLIYTSATFKDENMTLNYKVDKPLLVEFYLDGKLIASKNSSSGSNSITLDASGFPSGEHTLTVSPIHDDIADINTTVTIPDFNKLSAPKVTYSGTTFKDKNMILNFKVDKPVRVEFYLDGKLIASKNALVGSNSITLDATNLPSGERTLTVTGVHEYIDDISTTVTIPEIIKVEAPKVTYIGTTFKDNQMALNFKTSEAGRVEFYLDDKLIASKNALVGSNSIFLDASQFDSGKHTLTVKSNLNNSKDITTSVTIPDFNQAAVSKVTYISTTFKDNQMALNFKTSEAGRVEFYLDGKLIASKNALVGSNSIFLDASQFDSGKYTLTVKSNLSNSKDITTSVTIPNTNKVKVPQVTYSSTTFKDDKMALNFKAAAPVRVEFYLDGKLIASKNALVGSNSIFLDASNFTSGNHNLLVVTHQENASNSFTTTLTVPTSSVVSTNKNTYTVKKGDTLYSISSKNNLSLNVLKELNNLQSNSLHIGQILKLN